ncbi:alpha-tocopherol transfer protein-like [Maniola hyperantus]|uniref:alpha-tocopherol transfer protein-like n=1 Tax=Aphantopus hyperantus TaxID=2795564 RepID=UPI003749296A
MQYQRSTVSTVKTLELSTRLVLKMEFVPVDKILQVRPDTMQSIYKMYNLDTRSLKEAIQLLNEWVQKQPHFNKKDFGDRYLETAIIVCKGSIERAKSQLDKMCTMRTLMPHFFGKFNCKTDFEQLYEAVHSIVLPKLTDDHYRVHVIKFLDVDWEASQSIHFFRHNFILGEYIKAHDYLSGFIIILDYSEVNVMSVLTKINPVQLRQATTVLIEGYGMRIKGIYIISESKFVDGMVTLIKQVISAKIVNRVKVLKSVTDLHDFIPKAILPVDYGGEERSLKTLHEEWLDVLSSKEHLSYLEEINKATSNESCRPKDQLFEKYGGMPGTFRFLSVD